MGFLDLFGTAADMEATMKGGPVQTVARWSAMCALQTVSARQLSAGCAHTMQIGTPPEI
jgi:hypothetical protein